MPTIFNNIPVAYVDNLFVTQLDTLKEQARRMYISNLAGTSGSIPDPSEQRFWQIPESNGWSLNLFDISGISQAFDRDLINQVYVRALTKGPVVGPFDLAPEGEGRVADCMAMKIQIDYLAILERSFRLRHASSIRCMTHSAARRRGQSDWNDDAPITDFGDGLGPMADDVTGPIGGIFTTMIRHILLIIKGGYNEGPVDIIRPDTVVTTLADGSILAVTPD